MSSSIEFITRYLNNDLEGGKSSSRLTGEGSSPLRLRQITITNKLALESSKKANNIIPEPHKKFLVPRPKLSQTSPTSKKRRIKSLKSNNKTKISPKRKSSKCTLSAVKQVTEFLFTKETEDNGESDAVDTPSSLRRNASPLVLGEGESPNHPSSVSRAKYQRVLTEYFKAKRTLDLLRKSCRCKEKQQKLELINHAHNLDSINMERLSESSSLNTNYNNYFNIDDDPDPIRSPPVELPLVRVELQNQVLDSFATSLANQALRPTIVQVQIQNNSPLAMLRKMVTSQNSCVSNSSSCVSLEDAVIDLT